MVPNRGELGRSVGDVAAHKTFRPRIRVPIVPTVCAIVARCRDQVAAAMQHLLDDLYRDRAPFIG